MTIDTSDKHEEGGKFLPALCNILGWLILLSVIVACGAVTVPKLFGYETYEIISGSMEPAIPVGSLVFVQPIAPEDAQPGEIVAYLSGDSVVVHRVQKNQLVEGQLITKGDANAEEDINPVSYGAVIGRVRLHVPVAGSLMTACSSMLGKVYMIAFAACGVMLNMVAGRMRAHRKA